MTFLNSYLISVTMNYSNIAKKNSTSAFISNFSELLIYNVLSIFGVEMSICFILKKKQTKKVLFR